MNQFFAVGGYIFIVIDFCAGETIVTNAALERFIVMEMGNSVTIGAMNRYSRRRTSFDGCELFRSETEK